MSDTALGGIDLIWAGVGADSWEMIEQGATELVTDGDLNSVGSRILEVVKNNDRNWWEVEQIINEWFKNTTVKQMSDEEVAARAISQGMTSDGVTPQGTVWNEELGVWE